MRLSVGRRIGVRNGASSGHIWKMGAGGLTGCRGSQDRPDRYVANGGTHTVTPIATATNMPGKPTKLLDANYRPHG